MAFVEICFPIIVHQAIAWGWRGYPITCSVKPVIMLARFAVFQETRDSSTPCCAQPEVIFGIFGQFKWMSYELCVPLPTLSAKFLSFCRPAQAARCGGPWFSRREL